MRLIDSSKSYLAASVALGDGCASALSGHGAHKPGVLVSFAHHRLWQKFSSEHPQLTIGSFVIDSGAFTAFTAGKPIALGDYVEHLQRTPHDWALTLDVIGDDVETQRNLETLWSRGCEVVPVFHVGSSFSILKDMARTFPKIAIGGMVGMSSKAKLQFCSEVFAHAWPARLHGLGVGGEKEFMAFPWHSVDSASWALQPRGFGAWKEFGRLNVRETGGASLPLRSQVDWYLKLERRHNQTWKRELAILAELPKERTR